MTSPFLTPEQKAIFEELKKAEDLITTDPEAACVHMVIAKNKLIEYIVEERAKADGV